MNRLPQNLASAFAAHGVRGKVGIAVTISGMSTGRARNAVVVELWKLAGAVNCSRIWTKNYESH